MRQTLMLCRRKFSLTQAQLADKLNLSEVYVRKLENGSRNPSVSTMILYEKLFEVPMQELFPDVFQIKNDTKCI